MSAKIFLRVLVVAAFMFPVALSAEETATLPATQPLTLSGDLSAQMVAGIDTFLMREIERSLDERKKLWQCDFSSPDAYVKSVQPNRERFRKYIGAVDPRLRVSALEYVSDTTSPANIAETDAFTVFAVRWPVFENVYGEGLLLQPRNDPLARVVAIPDADQTPEMLAGLASGIEPELQFARRLAENGCQVLVPTLINREDTWSGNEKLKRFTNQPHREWIYRQAFELGRHIIGYEVQKVLAAIDWFENGTHGADSSLRTPHSALRIGVLGYAEGGLLALYSAALDTRIDAALVSAYFDSRQRVWEEPIYRNVFGLLHEFGDAEIASLIAPRSLIVEHSPVPKVDGPPKPHDGRSGGAPGKLTTPDYESVEAEFNRAKTLLANGGAKIDRIHLITGTEGKTTGPGSDRALTGFLQQLGLKTEQVKASDKIPMDLRKRFDAAQRQQRQVKQLEDYTQGLLRQSERVRADFFWNKAKANSPAEWETASKEFKNIFWEEVIGKFPPPTLPGNPRSRKIRDNAKWTAYEVVLDVWPDVYAWGYLLLPKDIKPGERRPVVVCQHGLEGVPEDTVTEDPKSGGYPYYKAFSVRLAERGFVVFAPHNPYRGQDKFRVLQRKANPLKKSLFSVILAQHDRILDWLSEQPFVDPQRIGFYGLSYGGKTAVRVPSLLDRYCLSICSADFNEWITKNVTVDSLYSYMFGGEYEMFEFNLGRTFSYAEMAALISPRPFMVERGHNDGVAPDEWVAYEYAKVRRHYDRLGIGDRTAIEIFNGPHTINGVGTYEFLHTHLNWPKR